MALVAEAVTGAALVEHRRGFARRWYRNPSFVGGVLILGTVVGLAICAPLVTKFDPTHQDLLNTLQPPGNWFQASVRWQWSARALAWDIDNLVQHGKRVAALHAQAIVSVAENQGGYMWSATYFPQVANVAAEARDSSVALGGSLQPLTLDVTIGFELAKQT